MSVPTPLTKAEMRAAELIRKINYLSRVIVSAKNKTEHEAIIENQIAAIISAEMQPLRDAAENARTILATLAPFDMARATNNKISQGQVLRAAKAIDAALEGK